jgi:hypothetical protein
MRVVPLDDHFGSVQYSDTFFDETMDGPVNVWGQMFSYAKERELKVMVETIHFTRVFSPMIGETDKVVGFEMHGVLVPKETA